jgi:hypothetical protein
MELGQEDQAQTVLTALRGTLSRAEATLTRLKHRHDSLVYVSLLAGLLATVVAGFAAAIGPMTGSGPNAWKVTCGVVAALTGCATFCSGLNEKLAVPDQLAKAAACAGRLRTLDLAITLAHRDPSEVARDYQEIVAQYQDILL